MWDDEFIKTIFEIAFGDNAFERGYSQEEVLTRLRQFSDTALKLENIIAAVEQAKEQAS